MQCDAAFGLSQARVWHIQPLSTQILALGSLYQHSQMFSRPAEARHKPMGDCSMLPMLLPWA